MFVMLVAATFILAKTGELVSKEYGWLAGVLIFTNNYWMLTWTNFEDDILGLFFLLISLYFFVKNKKEQRDMWLIISLFFCLLAGLFWNGAFLWLLGFSLSSLPFLIALILVFYFVINNDFGSITNTVFPNFNVSENTFFSGWAYQLGLWVGSFNLYGFFWPQIGFWVFIALLNEKFAPILSIYLALGVVSWLEKPMFFINWKEKLLANGKLILVLLVGSMLLVSSYKLVTAYPTENQVEAVKFSIEKAGGETVLNDWSYGYWILYYGGSPLKAGGGPEDNNLGLSGIYLSERKLDCPMLKDFGHGFNDNIKVYSC